MKLTKNLTKKLFVCNFFPVFFNKKSKFVYVQLIMELSTYKESKPLEERVKEVNNVKTNHPGSMLVVIEPHRNCTIVSKKLLR